MSFSPDYRDKVDELKGESRAVINGYQIAAEEAKASVEDMLDEEKDDDYDIGEFDLGDDEV